MRSLGAVVGWMVLLAAAMSAQDAGPARPSLLKASFATLPIYFIENRGVYPSEVAYYVQGADKTLFFTKDGITFWLKGRDRCWVVKLDFVGAGPDVMPRGQDRRKAVFSYFRGPERDWKTGLPTFSKILYRELWPGIDLVFRGTADRLKYEFVVKPGADPGTIRLRYQGASAIKATHEGGLRVETPVGSFEDAPPIAHQEVDGVRAPVEMAYALGEDDEFRFDSSGHDRTRSLIIDPAVFVYCGYIGGSADDRADAVCVDAFGNAYITGATRSAPSTFPVKTGPYPNPTGGGEAFVAKVNPAGTALIYCGYLGGTREEFGQAIAVDAVGEAYVAGRTESAESSFPVKNGPGLKYGGGFDGFVAKVNAAGTALVYCGYIGGDHSDQCEGIAVDPAGNAYVTGVTYSTPSTFPVKVGPFLKYGGGTSDAFVAKVSPSGSNLVYCGYIGGADGDVSNGIAVDTQGHAYLAGSTVSSQATFPVRVGPGLKHMGASDAFVAKVNAAGTALLYCGYIGGSIEDRALGIALDAAGNAYVTGYSVSPSGFPVKVGPDITYNGGMVLGDAFVARVNASGSTLDYCGYIGGKDDEVGNGIAVDAAGCAYVAGWTWSTETTFPVKVGPDLSFNPAPYPKVATDAFVAKVEAGGVGLVYCGYVGGSSGDSASAIAVDHSGNAYLVGTTGSSHRSFPVVAGPDLTYNGKYGAEDAFVAKVALTLLQGSGPARPGANVSLNLTASDDAALPYQLGTSLGTGPIPIDTRKLDLSLDDLLLITVHDYWPSVFSGYRGVIDSRGQAQAAIHIPNVPALIGVRLHSAFVTLDPAAPSGIRSISNTFTFSVTK